MPTLSWKSCVVVLTVAVSGCSSKPVAPIPECLPPPAPPAWMMQEQPSSIPLLDKIISPSEAS